MRNLKKHCLNESLKKLLIVHSSSTIFIGIFWPACISMRICIGKRNYQRVVGHIPRLFGQNRKWVKKLSKKGLSHKLMARIELMKTC